MQLKTNYLGLELASPLVPAASPLSEEFDNLKRMEDAGASAIVFHSLFEEQLRQESETSLPHLQGTEDWSEVLSYFPKSGEFQYGPSRYLENLQRAKAALGIPLIASLNGRSFGGWLAFAKAIEKAGADALELNLYSIPANPNEMAEEIENQYLTIVASIKNQLKIPVAVKLSPFFTNLANVARRMDKQGVDGLVLFNRFYQPDIDLESNRLMSSINLSTSWEIRLPMRWIAILHGQVKASLAATSGINSGTDALKLLMVGADVTMLCSVLLRRGIDHLKVIEREMTEWLDAHGYDSIAQIKGMLSQKNCPDPTAFERAQYMRAIAVDRNISQG